MKKCKYCDIKYNELTKEHIFPNFFYELLGLKDNSIKYLSFNESFNIFNRKELFIKDVCSNCNNNILSKLDIEFSLLIKNYILYGTFTNQVVNYQKISKWLLKTFYNSHLYIEQKSMIELYKNKYINNNILKNKPINNELLFSMVLKGNEFNNNFMSIGTLLEPKKFIKYLDIYNFIQIKNHMFIFIIFKKSKYHKKYAKGIKKYLENEYNAIYHPKVINLQTLPNQKLPIEYIFNANEDDTNIPFKLLCKLQWNLHSKIDSISDMVSKFVKNPINHNIIVKNFNINPNAIYSSGKSLLISLDEFAILLHFNNEQQITKYAYDINRFHYKDIDKVQEYKNASIIINRYENLTILKMNDLDDKDHPFIGNLSVTQNDDNWNKFKENIIKQNHYMYIAISKEKAIEKQLKNNYINNIIFISKIKVIQV